MWIILYEKSRNIFKATRSFFFLMHICKFKINGTKHFFSIFFSHQTSIFFLFFTQKYCCTTNIFFFTNTNVKKVFRKSFIPLKILFHYHWRPQNIANELFILLFLLLRAVKKQKPCYRCENSQHKISWFFFSSFGFVVQHFFFYIFPPRFGASRNIKRSQRKKKRHFVPSPNR